eukprot:6188144-Pleurochrysis_carterae.AAC.2
MALYIPSRSSDFRSCNVQVQTSFTPVCPFSLTKQVPCGSAHKLEQELNARELSVLPTDLLMVAWIFDSSWSATVMNNLESPVNAQSPLTAARCSLRASPYNWAPDPDALNTGN